VSLVSLHRTQRVKDSEPLPYKRIELYRYSQQKGSLYTLNHKLTL